MAATTCVVSEVADPAEVDRLVDRAWVITQAGQLTFPLDAQESEADLRGAWQRMAASPSAHVLAVHSGATLVGACAVAVDEELSTRNGPFLFEPEPGILDALVLWLGERYAGRTLGMGIDPAYGSVKGWLEGRGELVEATVVTRAELRDEPPAPGTHRMTLDEAPLFRSLMAPLDDEMWWRSDRVLEAWDRWVVVADDAGRACANALLLRGGHDEAEVFAFAPRLPHGPDGLRLVRGLNAELRRVGVGRCLAFVEPDEVATMTEAAYAVLGRYERWALRLP